MTEENIFTIVKENYGRIATNEINGIKSSCCGSEDTNIIDLNVKSSEVLSLGCYNGLAEKAGLQKGITVLDLGSGPGYDLINAAEIIGPKGRVIGLDMTDEMIELGKRNTEDFENIEIIKGNLQDIPLEDNCVDVIISNCVFNLTPDKGKAFSEAYRVLKPGGRIVESDVALEYSLPQETRGNKAVYCGCIGGAIPKGEYIKHMENAGFTDILTENLSTSQYVINEKVYPYHSILFSGKKQE